MCVRRQCIHKPGARCTVEHKTRPAIQYNVSSPVRSLYTVRLCMCVRRSVKLKASFRLPRGWKSHLPLITQAWFHRTRSPSLIPRDTAVHQCTEGTRPWRVGSCTLADVMLVIPETMHSCLWSWWQRASPRWFLCRLGWREDCSLSVDDLLTVTSHTLCVSTVYCCRLQGPFNESYALYCSWQHRSCHESYALCTDAVTTRTFQRIKRFVYCNQPHSPATNRTLCVLMSCWLHKPCKRIVRFAYWCWLHRPCKRIVRFVLQVTVTTQTLQWNVHFVFIYIYIIIAADCIDIPTNRMFCVLLLTISYTQTFHG